MARLATFWLRSAVAAIALLCAGQLFAQSGQDVAVIVNPKNSVDNLSTAELAKIFRGERQYWRANLPVLVLMRNAGSVDREVVLRTIFHMTEPQYKQYWISRIMRADATSPPAEVYSSGMTK